MQRTRSAGLYPSRESVTTTRKQAERAYDKVHKEKRNPFA